MSCRHLLFLLLFRLPASGEKDGVVPDIGSMDQTWRRGLPQCFSPDVKSLRME